LFAQTVRDARVQEDEKLLEGVVLAHPKEVSLEPYTTPVPSYAFSLVPLSAAPTHILPPLLYVRRNAGRARRTCPTWPGSSTTSGASS
jgi:hypothetical protein